MKLAAIQMVSGASVQANLDSARTLLAEAAAGGAELAVLPEYFCLLGHRDTDKLDVQEAFGKGPIQHFLAEMARSLGIWIVGGTLPLTGSDEPLVRDRSSLPHSNDGATPTVRRIFNSSLVFAPDGQCIQRYDKIHLFRYDNGRERYDESRVLMRGDKPAMFDLPSCDGHVWKVGQSVCYDLRFPELYRTYAAAGADLLLVPSAFTHTTGQAHWEVLLRARAIENMAFVAAPAQGGLHENGRRTWGHSMQLDPWGAILSERVEGAGVDVVDLDWQKLLEFRLQLPALEHRVL